MSNFDFDRLDKTNKVLAVRHNKDDQYSIDKTKIRATFFAHWKSSKPISLKVQTIL